MRGGVFARDRDAAARSCDAAQHRRVDLVGRRLEHHGGRVVAGAAALRRLLRHLLDAADRAPREHHPLRFGDARTRASARCRAAITAGRMRMRHARSPLIAVRRSPCDASADRRVSAANAAARRRRCANLARPPRDRIRIAAGAAPPVRARAGGPGRAGLPRSYCAAGRDECSLRAARWRCASPRVELRLACARWLVAPCSTSRCRTSASRCRSSCRRCRRRPRTRRRPRSSRRRRCCRPRRTRPRPSRRCVELNEPARALRVALALRVHGLVRAGDRARAPAAVRVAVLLRGARASGVRVVPARVAGRAVGSPHRAAVRVAAGATGCTRRMRPRRRWARRSRRLAPTRRCSGCTRSRPWPTPPYGP